MVQPTWRNLILTTEEELHKEREEVQDKIAYYYQKYIHSVLNYGLSYELPELVRKAILMLYQINWIKYGARDRQSSHQRKQGYFYEDLVLNNLPLEPVLNILVTQIAGERTRYVKL
jgi:hypothetical protein